MTWCLVGEVGGAWLLSREKKKLHTAHRILNPHINLSLSPTITPAMAASLKIDSPLPAFSGEWTNESNFISHASISEPINRKLEPLGPHFLAHARRVRFTPRLHLVTRVCTDYSLQKRHSRTFSEDDRIQASQKVKNVEDEDAGEISEPEDPAMLSRDPKDWKV